MESMNPVKNSPVLLKPDTAASIAENCCIYLSLMDVILTSRSALFSLYSETSDEARDLLFSSTPVDEITSFINSESLLAQLCP